MQHPFKIALVLTGVLSGTGLYAQTATQTATPESGFNNFLLRSPSIVSPSQNYQVKQGRFEAFVGSANGTIDPKDDAAGGDVDVTGLDLGLAAYYAVSPMAVIGLDVDLNNNKADGLKSNSTEISPSVAFNITPMFNLGLAAHLVSGSQDNVGGGDENTDFNYFTIGATMHSDLWEATLAFNTESDDDNKPQNNSAQSYVLHGRYKVLPNMALGLSLFQRDSSALSSAVAHAKDETGYGLHLETAFTDVFNAEFAFLGSSNVDGASGDDSTEFVAIGNYRVTPTVDVGLRLSYLTLSGDAADVTGFNPGVFVSTVF